MQNITSKPLSHSVDFTRDPSARYLPRAMLEVTMPDTPTDAAKAAIVQTMLSNTSQFRGLLDLAGCFTELNQLALDFLGVQRDALFGQPIWGGNWWPSQETRLEVQRQTQLAASGSFSQAEYEIESQGQRLWIEFLLKPIRNPDGNVVMILAEGNDISERKRLEQTLFESEEKHRSVLEAMSEGVVQFEADGTISMCNTAAERILGRTKEEIVSRNVDRNWRIITEDGQPLSIAEPNTPTAMTFRTGKPQSNWVMGIYKPSGELTWVLVNTQPLIRSGETSPYAVITTLTDITAQKTAELHQRALITTMSEGLVYQKADGTITTCNPAAEEILGLTKDQMMGRTSLDPRWRAVHEDGSDFPGETHPAMVTLHTGEAQSSVVMGVYKPSGELTWILINSQPVFSSGHPLPDGVVCTFTDITLRKELEDKLRHAALYDSLTGLATRTFLMERLTRAMGYAKREARKDFAVLFIDLDNFKKVNDSLGHAAGDALLVEVARTLKTNTRETDTVARLGGDEFVILLERLEAQQVKHFAKRILEHLHFDIPTLEGSIHVSGSIGVAVYDPRFSTPEELLASADKAMYQAKASGKGQATLW